MRFLEMQPVMQSPGRWILSCLIVALFGYAHAALAAEPAKPTVFELDPRHAEKMAASTKLFEAKVRAILTSKCLKCHGGEKTESEFDLATREQLLQGGVYNDHNVIPGDAAKSFLLKVVAHTEEPKMPEGGAKLADTEIAALTEWINLGAAYDKPLVEKNDDPLAWTKKTVGPDARQHWSLQPLAKVTPPHLNEPFIKTPIDNFILLALRKQGLTPNPPADKRTLLRRAYFDLIGLPPTPEETKAFLADEGPDAYGRLLDGLLARPQYGERWARHWLDVARFAESHGFEQDYDRPYAYHFRDFVIEALNQDMPFTQFAQWQLAGDELAPTNPLALKATGFLGAGVFPTQITANEVERTRYDAIDDMAATTSTAFLGLTVGCARCHDHKFDPIPQADYYRFASTFVTTVRSEQEVEIDAADYQAKKRVFDVQHAPLVAAVAEYEANQLPAKLFAWEKEQGAAVKQAKWMTLEFAEAKSAGGATLTKQPDGSLLAGGKNPDFDTYTFVVTTQAKGITGFRLEALAHPSLVKGGPGRADNGNIDLTDFRVIAQPADGKSPPIPIKLQNPQATFEQKPSLLAAFAIDGDKKSGWALDPQFGKDHAVTFETAEDLGFEGGTKLTFTLEFNGNNRHNIGRPRLSLTTQPRPLALAGETLSQAVLQALETPFEKRTPEHLQTLVKWYAPQDAGWQKLNKAVQDHLAQAPQPKRVKVMICSEGVTPIRHHTQGADFFKEFYFCHRGDCNQKRGEATQSFLQVLMSAPDGVKHWQQPPPENARTSHRRAALARWITDTEYGAGQLAARVIVNRVWQHHFGQGLVATANDFGKQGTPPSHPELLDWLAQDFINNGWKMKRLHKLIMTSSVYRQSSSFDAAKFKLDESNRWLWRYSPRRLEAEVIRDSLLAVSGQLDAAMYGPGTLDERHRRRSIYFMIKRSRLIPMMTLFDAPEPLVSVGNRPATTIAPQALAFMNNPEVRNWAKALGTRLSPAAEKSTADAVKLGYLTTVAREPDADELAAATTFIDAQIASYTAAGKQNARELALADFAQVLFGLNEFVYAD